MNIAKNMEAIFVAALIVAGVTSYATATAAVPTFRAAHSTVVAAADAGTIPTVVVTAKRLNAEQKAVL